MLYLVLKYEVDASFHVLSLFRGASPFLSSLTLLLSLLPDFFGRRG